MKKTMFKAILNELSENPGTTIYFYPPDFRGYDKIHSNTIKEVDDSEQDIIPLPDYDEKFFDVYKNLGRIQHKIDDSIEKINKLEEACKILISKSNIDNMRNKYDEKNNHLENNYDRQIHSLQEQINTLSNMLSCEHELKLDNIVQIEKSISFSTYRCKKCKMTFNKTNAFL